MTGGGEDWLTSDSDNLNTRAFQSLTQAGCFTVFSQTYWSEYSAALAFHGQECSLLSALCVCVCLCLFVCVHVLFLLLQSDGANIHTEASNVPTWLGTRVMAFFVRRVNLVERVLGADDGGKACRSVGREVSVQPESVSDVGPDVLGLALQPVQERHQLHQLVVRLVHEPRLNGNPILQLISKSLQTR